MPTNYCQTPTMEAAVQQAEELKDLRETRRLEEDAIRRRYMSLIKATRDVSEYIKLNDEKVTRIEALASRYKGLEADLAESHKRANDLTALHHQQVSSSPAPAPTSFSHDNNTDQGPRNEETEEQASLRDIPASQSRPSTEVRREISRSQHQLILRIQSIHGHQKRKASFEVSKDVKRSRPDCLADTHGTAVTDPAASTAAPQPSQQQAPSTAQEISYAEVRRRATEDGHWDSIMEYPPRGKAWYILYCQDHHVHFKQSAIRAAAKHLNSSAHNFPNRNSLPAIAALGFRIPDCTPELASKYNRDVETAYKCGYEPANATKYSGKKVKYPFEGQGDHPDQHDSTRPEPRLIPKANNGSSSGLALEPAPTQHLVANPKTFHIYYSEFPEDVDGERIITYWPVIILGWDDLRPGKIPNDTSNINIQWNTLHETGLLRDENKPPRCYEYGDQGILGWAAGYDDSSSAIKLRNRKFPVMYFDDFRSFGWVSATWLSKFGLERRGPPKRRGYSEIAFHEAREFVAKREGFADWGERERARKNGTLARWTPRVEQPSSRADSRTNTTNPTRSSDKDKSGSLEPVCSDDELRALKENAVEIPGDDDYKDLDDDDPGEDGEDTDTDADIDADVMPNLEKTEWPSNHSAQSEDRASSVPEDLHVTRPSPREPTIPPMPPKTNEQTLEPRAPTPVTAIGPTRKFTAKRTGMSQFRASLPPRPIKSASALPPLESIASLPPRPLAPVAGPSPLELLKQPTAQASISDKNPTAEESGQPIITRVTHTINLPRTAATTPPVASNELTGPHRFEVCEYDSDGYHWKRSSCTENGIRLFQVEDGKGLQSSPGCPVNVRIDAAEWGALSNKSITGNCIVTITRTDGTKSIKMIFDRKDGDDTVKRGRQQARDFVSWLRGERKKLNLTLDASLG
ncbi:hypothetical protein BKA67DRAFT_586616 [Truncatella angustata]|uniref:Uncharacterized protein n=1 Tax=Truncatella angustata TaxID=152316 RepID=A0A9P8UBI6_9PEZI|nr:uncharacterized protein BKA67DRAFT_586616 [Truncatella angustata]KAH6644975.1 hypothetical protein BKA67DRAFT_586616 [Truncatella angustata]